MNQMPIDLAVVQAGQFRYADLMRNGRHADPYKMTDELFRHGSVQAQITVTTLNNPNSEK